MVRTGSCDSEPTLKPDVEPAANNGRTPMMKFAMAGALLIAFAAPGLAQSSSTTTATTTSGSDSFYVVRDPTTKRCTVTTEKPSSSTTVVVGSTTYKSRTEAEGAVKTTKVCTDD